MLAGNNFTENFKADFPWKFFGMSKTICTTGSAGEFINYY